MTPKMQTFKIKGKMRSGKNSMQIDPRTGRHYPKKDFVEWRDGIFRQLIAQVKLPIRPFTKHCWFNVVYTPPDRIRRDLPGIMDALWHCLEKADIVENDYLLKNCAGWLEEDPDKENPGLTIQIWEVED